MKTLEDLNIIYVYDREINEEINGGAILKCSYDWTRDQLNVWLPEYDFDMIDTVKKWLADDCQIAEEGWLKVWVDCQAPSPNLKGENMEKLTALLTDGTVGEFNGYPDNEYISAIITVTLHDENGNPIKKTGEVEEIL